ncbi:MAG: LysR substrate-binding domain-containing protein [Bacteroidota bacterium]
MTLQQLTYALALQQHRSFKIASQKLFISQPALSVQIQKLEDELDIILFDRSASPISVTEEGKLFLIRAEEIVTSASALKNFTKELKQDVSGQFKIGIIPTLAPFLVPLFSDHLQEVHPKLNLDFSEMTTNRVIEGVRKGELDTGLIATPVNVFGIVSEPIFYEKFFFYASSEFAQGNGISLKNIDYDQLWLLNEGNCFRDQINNFCDQNEIRKGKRFIYRSNSIDALIRIVDLKGGMTILPELTTLSLSVEQEDNIAPIGKKAREIGIINRKNNSKERFTNELINAIKENIPSVMLSKEGLEVVDPEIIMN